MVWWESPVDKYLSATDSRSAGEIASLFSFDFKIKGATKRNSFSNIVRDIRKYLKKAFVVTQLHFSDEIGILPLLLSFL